MEANKSAMKALLMNRVGDWGLTIGILYIYGVYQNVEYSIISGMGGVMMGEGGITGSYMRGIEVMTVYILIGAIAKSAQIGLHTWLPNAMEAPTPVSALLHAATLVTAGVYIIIRTSPIMEMVPSSLMVVSGLGGMTALYGAIAGIYQNDIKRIIAYSTCSQLGYMVLACGVSQYSVALYHLLNHAYFKALLFLSAGCVIHGMGDEQDIRRMGGMMKIMPLIYTGVLIGSLSLMALPYLSGYYSKDMILEVTRGQYRINGRVTNWLGMITATITSLYTVRMIAYTFVNGVNGRERVYSGMMGGVKREDIAMYEVPLVILGVGSIVLGYMTKEIYVGIGTTMVSGIYVNPMNKVGMEIEEIGGIEKMLPVISTVMGGVIYVILRKGRREERVGMEMGRAERRSRKEETAEALLDLKGTKERNTAYGESKEGNLVERGKNGLPGVGVEYKGRWMNMVVVRTGRGYDWWDKIYNGVVISGGSKVSYMMAKNVDKGVVELIGPLGLRRVLGGVSRRMMELDSGYILHYGLYIIVGAVVIVGSIIME